jgi:YVTN family beta-propeller protein/probable HAF family extracellular repeat protein
MFSKYRESKSLPQSVKTVFSTLALGWTLGLLPPLMAQDLFPVVQTLTVGSKPYGLTVSPDGSHVYVANSGSNNLSVIDTATNQIQQAPIPAGVNPVDVRTTPDGQRLYVVNGLQTNGTLSVIQASTGALIQTIPGLGNFPQALAISPNGSLLYVANAASNTVSVVDSATNQVVGAAINLGQTYPLAVAFTPNGKHAYVVNAVSNSVSVIATSTSSLVGSPIPVGPLPDGISITPDGKKAYVENWGTNGTGTTISVINIAKGQVTKTITVGPGPSQSAITPDGNYLLVPIQGSPAAPGKTITIISTQTDSVIADSIPVGNLAAYVAITPDGRYAYVTNQADGTVSVIDISLLIAPYIFTDLGSFAGDYSYAYSINNQSVVVGQASDPKTDFYAFRFANGKLHNLRVPKTDKQSNYSSAYGINDSDVAVGDYSVGHLAKDQYDTDPNVLYHACQFANGSVTDLGTLGTISYALSINDAGWIVGGSRLQGEVGNPQNPPVAHAFLFQPGNSGLMDLGTLGGSFSQANHIDNVGVIVGTSQTATGSYVPFWTEATSIGLAVPVSQLPTLTGGAQGDARGSAFELVNDTTMVVGDSQTASGTYHAVQWSLFTSGLPIKDLGTLPGFDSSRATAINLSAQIVGYCYQSSGNGSYFFDSTQRAFLVENELMRNLNDLTIGLPAGWILRVATAINDYGQIVGFGTTSNGTNHAFLLSPTRPNILVGTFPASQLTYESAYFLQGLQFSFFRPLTDNVVVSNEQPKVSILDGTAKANRSVFAAFFSPGAPLPGFAITQTDRRLFIAGAGGDTYVLQESFNPQDPFVIQTGVANVRLLYFDPTTGMTQNAVLANTGNSRPLFKLGAFDPKTDFHLGTYGVDPVNNVVWAVLNFD